ncbi:hypothetical protein RRG08_031887 [Elysia crispata]|uniref:Uncharacterized protein n=1 Tax=Elysia crispata TaxID=231223 RepID=A0AAE1AI43_9GAST|nr:hypothetical protein RRG08_031887 [Elysia crispata]
MAFTVDRRELGQQTMIRELLRKIWPSLRATKSLYFAGLALEPPKAPVFAGLVLEPSQVYVLLVYFWVDVNDLDRKQKKQGHTIQNFGARRLDGLRSGSKNTSRFPPEVVKLGVTIQGQRPHKAEVWRS